MNELLTYDDVKDVVESRYPMPIAAVFRKCRTASPQDLGGRHKNLVDLFEVLVKFLCIVYLQQARRTIPNLKARLPNKEKTLDFLRHPSLGGWVGLLRILCDVETDASQSKWMTLIADWYSEPRNEGNRQLLGLLADVGARYEKRSRTPNAEICNALVNYRNKQLGHGANPSEEELAKRMPILEGAIVHLLQSASFLGEMTTCTVDRIEVLGKGLFGLHCFRLTGIAEDRATFQYSGPEELEKSEIYLFDQTEGALDESPLALGPFLLWQVNEDLKRSEVYFYNDAWRTKLEYLSYTSGTYHYHRELHSDFRELITLKLTPGAEEDAYHAMPPEERAARAEDLSKRARLYLQKERLEDALEAFELSVEYQRRASTFVFIARIQQDLGMAPDAVRQTLEHCLELDAENGEAIALIDALTAAENVPATEEKSEYREHEVEGLTLYRLALPRRLRAYVVAVWTLLLLGWFGVSAGVEYLYLDATDTVEVRKIFATLAGLLVACLVIVDGQYISRSILLRLKTSLSLQLDTMSWERFDDWFGRQFRDMFGHFAFDGGMVDYKETFRREWWYYLGFLIWVAILNGSVYTAAEMHELPGLLLAKRMVDYTLFAVLMYPGCRYMFGMTMMVYRYSRLSLKPMLSTDHGEGLHALGALLVSHVGLMTLAYVGYYGPHAYVHTADNTSDLLLHPFIDVLVLSWSIGMPIIIQRAGREAKSKAIQTYRGHLERAFNAFIDSPDDERLERYNWLVRPQFDSCSDMNRGSGGPGPRDFT